jgi:hypothetical protein
LVSLRKFDETITPKPLILHPTGSLVIQQKMLPLAVKIDKVGNQRVSDIQKVEITSAESKSGSNPAIPLSVKSVDESFARAQYQNLTDAEKLSKPSFEKMPGGVEISAASGQSLKTGKMVRKKVAYEITIIDKEPKKPLKFGLFFTQIGILFNNFLKGNSVSKSSLSKNYADKLQPYAEKTKVSEEGYTVAYQANNKAFNGQATFSSEFMAQTYMQEQVKSNPTLHKEIHIIPNYELQEI